MGNHRLCIALLGPTASGKSEFSMNLAARLGSEIVSMDSTTIYREFDIGSSKPPLRDLKLVKHHLMSVLDPKEGCSAGKFVSMAEESIASIEAEQKIPVVVGGTNFYLKALQFGMYDLPDIPKEITEGIEQEFSDGEGIDSKALFQKVVEQDPDSAKNIHPKDRYRLVRALAILRATGKKPSELKPVKGPIGERLWIKYALLIPRSELIERINRRTDEMLKNGLVEETKKLRQKFPGVRALNSIGYKEAGDFLDQKLTEKELRSEIIEKTRQLAKRQMTWLRSDPEVRFIDRGDLDRVFLEVENMTFVFQQNFPGKELR